MSAFQPKSIDSLFIGGQWVKPRTGRGIEVTSPFSEAVVGRAACAEREDIDRAVNAARQAFDHGPWPRLSASERIDAIDRLKAVFTRRLEEMAGTITAEMGSPITASQGPQTQAPLAMLDAFMNIAKDYPWRELRRTPMGSSFVYRHPKGIVAAIVPWNAPMMTTVMKLAPALLSGCCVILKPAAETPLSALLLAEMIEEAGFPEGVVSVLPTDNANSEYLALHPGVDKVTFTGSTSVGRYLASKCGELLRPITLELGGKSAGIILDDADIAAAVEALRLGSFRNSGQICSLKTRILVSTTKKAEVVEALAALIDSMPVGDPWDPQTQIGPMASLKQMERVGSYIEKGLAAGFRATRGGPGKPKHLNSGWFVRPTLFEDVTPDSVIAQEEIFGPVLSVITYGDEEEAIAIANNSPYGLNGSVFSRDVERAEGIARRIKTGTVEINGNSVGFYAPIGGFKESGIGREAGPEGFNEYVNLQSVGLPADFAARL
jgi:betaine-aldehyde dehydrogenase